MSSIASTDSPSHDAGPTTFSQALPEMSGNSVSPIRAPQDTPEILAWLNLPYDDDTPMPTSFVTRRRLIVESTPEANPGERAAQAHDQRMCVCGLELELGHSQPSGPAPVRCRPRAPLLQHRHATPTPHQPRT